MDEAAPRSQGLHQTLPQRKDSPILFEAHKQLDPRQRLLQIPMWHAHLEVKYFLKGSAQIHCGSHTFCTQPGDLIIINPYEYHSTQVCDRDAPPVYHLMNIDLSHPAVRGVLQLPPEYAPDSAPYFKSRIQRADLHCVRLFSLLAEACITQGAEFTPYQESLLRAFLQSLVLESTAGNTTRSPAVLALMPAMAYIDRHFRENISVAALASCCTLSVSRFSHLFRQVTGTTAVQYINDLRISKAAALLTATALDIGQIAAQTGFRDSAYFSRLFSRACGCSPREFRISQTKKHAAP